MRWGLALRYEFNVVRHDMARLGVVRYDRVRLDVARSGAVRLLR